MRQSFKGERTESPRLQILRTSLAAALVIVLISSAGAVYAQTARQEGWYRLRTNSVPYKPRNVAVDSAGGLWVTAVDGAEYDPGVWYRPASPLESPFRYFTDDLRNNLLSDSYNPPVVMPQLDVSVLCAVRDNEGNTWYSLKNRTVLCEKADHTWLTFTMPDSSSLQPGVDTTNVDSVHRIRLITRQDGSREILLIANRGILRINAGLSIVETRQVYSAYNNYFIGDALIDSLDRYWITSEAGVEKGTSFVNTTYVSTEFASDPNAPTGAISRIMEDSAGNIWFGSDFYTGDAIYCYTAAGQWNKYSDGPVNTFGKRAHDIAAGSDGSVWFGSVYSGAGGILRYAPDDGGQWTLYTQADLGLQSGEILSMAFDPAGLWFATAYHSGITGNGTGVHYLTFDGDQPDVTHYTYRNSSTTLTTLRYNHIAADKSGNVWFPAYDDPSIARLNADGTWQQFRQSGAGGFECYGFAGVAVDSRNRIYFAPLNYAPVAYDATQEEWVDLPSPPFTEYYYYGVYVDPQDGKWFHGAHFIYYLDPDNTTWTSIHPDSIEGFPENDYVENGVLFDDAQNVWFMARSGVVLRKNDPGGGEPTWIKFTSGDAHGYAGGYRVYQDDTGQVWNAGAQRFNPEDTTWTAAADTGALDQRHLRFLNGRVSAGLDLSGALSPITALDERYMTVDSRGTIYFTGWLGNITAGIVAFGPPKGDLDGSGTADLTDAILAAEVMANATTQVLAGGDINGDGKIGLAEMIYALQCAGGLR